MTSLIDVWELVRPWLEPPASLHARVSATSKREWTESSWRSAYVAAIRGWVAFRRTLDEMDLECFERCLKRSLKRHMSATRMEIVDTGFCDHGPGYIVDIIVKMFCDDASIYSAHYGEGPLLSLQFRTRRRPDMFASLPQWVAEFTHYQDLKDVSGPRNRSEFERSFRCTYVDGDDDAGEAFHYGDAAGYVLHSTGFYVAENAAEKLIVLIDKFVQFRAHCLAKELQTFIVLPKLRVYHPLGDAVGIMKYAVQMACDVEVYDVELLKKMPLYGLRPLWYPLRFVVCNVDYDDSGHFHFAYGDNLDPYHESFNAAGIQYAMCGPRTLGEIFRVVNDIPNREALAQFARIHREVLKRSPIFVRMSAKTYSKVENIWTVLGLNDVESMAVIRFSTWAQPFLATVLRCHETSVWREVRFLLNALTFLAQVAEMENVYLRG